MLFSFNTKTLDEIGIDPGSDITVADHMCDLLRSDVRGDCVAYEEFRRAFDPGDSFAGVPMDRAVGVGLAVHVERRCPGDESASNDASSEFSGVGANSLGVFDPARDGHVYHVPLVYADKAEYNSVFFVQNSGSCPLTSRSPCTLRTTAGARRLFCRACRW